MPIKMKPAGSPPPLSPSVSQQLIDEAAPPPRLPGELLRSIVWASWLLVSLLIFGLHLALKDQRQLGMESSLALFAKLGCVYLFARGIDAGTRAGL